VKYVHVPRRVLVVALAVAVAPTLVATATIGVMAMHASGGTGSSPGGFNCFITSAVDMLMGRNSPLIRHLCKLS
jgi:hypothetical protein